MKVKVIDANGEPLHLATRWQIVVYLSERNCRNLVAQIDMSQSAGWGRKAYGSLVKQLPDGGPRMIVAIEADGDHYDDDGIAR